MPLDPDALLRGPRGRDLCLAVAGAADDPPGGPRRPGEPPTPLTDALWRLETAGGSPYVLLEDLAARPVPPRPVPTPVSPADPDDLLAALATVPVAPIDPDSLPELLGGVVESARYWEEPERVDAVLARPDAVPLLRPWADELARTPGTAWWADGLDRADQHVVRGPGFEPQKPVTVRCRLAEHRRDLVEAEGSARRRAAWQRRYADPRANISGVWWSAPLGVPTTTRRWPQPRPVTDPTTGRPGGSVRDPLGALLVEDSTFHADEAVWEAVAVPGNARVLELTSEQVWADLCREHPIDVSFSRMHDWYRCTGRNGAWVVPDWSAVAQRWDAVHLPVAGYLDLAGRPIDVDGTRASLLAGWSPDETCWFVDLPR